LVRCEDVSSGYSFAAEGGMMESLLRVTCHFGNLWRPVEFVVAQDKNPSIKACFDAISAYVAETTSAPFISTNLMALPFVIS
jgi:hypothetical protein